MTSWSEPVHCPAHVTVILLCYGLLQYKLKFEGSPWRAIQWQIVLLRLIVGLHASMQPLRISFKRFTEHAQKKECNAAIDGEAAGGTCLSMEHAGQGKIHPPITLE